MTNTLNLLMSKEQGFLDLDTLGIYRSYKQLLDLKYLPQILHIRLVIAHILGWRIGQFGDRLAVTAHHFHDDLKRRVAEVVGQIGADTKCHFRAILEAQIQRNYFIEIEAVREHQDLALGV